MDQFLKQFEAKLVILAESLKQELGGIRTSRPTSKLVEDVRVSYAEQTLTVKQLGTITVQPPRDIVVTVWDKAAAPPIAKAIEDARLGLTPSAEGNVIRMQLPALTMERRAELTKIAKAATEKVRIRLRSERDEAVKRIEQMAKGKQITEDQKFKGKKQLQEAVDKVNKNMEDELQRKVREISE